jgi:hypothetical protein
LLGRYLQNGTRVYTAVPITATRLPAKVTLSCGQFAVWQDWPMNVSIPAMRGMVGAESMPMAVINRRVL